MVRYLIITTLALSFIHSYCSGCQRCLPFSDRSLFLILLTTAIIITLTLNLYILNDSTVRALFVFVIYDGNFGWARSCRMLNTYTFSETFWYVCYLVRVFIISSLLLFENGSMDVHLAKLNILFLSVQNDNGGYTVECQ